MRSDDPAAVREQYATEAGLSARAYVVNVPELDEPLVARKRITVFVASTDG